MEAGAQDGGECAAMGACICEDSIRKNPVTGKEYGRTVGLFALNDPEKKIVKVKMATADGGATAGYKGLGCPSTEKKDMGYDKPISVGVEGATAFPCPEKFTLTDQPDLGTVIGWAPQANGDPSAGYPDEGNAC